MGDMIPLLRRPCLRRLELSEVYHTGLEPLLEQKRIHRNMLQEPIMVDGVETSLYVCIQDPFRRAALVEKILDLRDGVLRRTANPEPIGVPVSRRFGHGLQSEQVQGLHGPVRKGRDAQRASRSIALGDTDPSQRFGGVTPSALQQVHCRPFRNRRRPHLPVNAGGVLATVFRDPSDGQGTAAKRTGQVTLQGFHPTPRHVASGRAIRSALEGAGEPLVAESKPGREQGGDDDGLPYASAAKARHLIQHPARADREARDLAYAVPQVARRPP